MTTKKPMVITLQPHEVILSVVPEYAHGPGWANAPLWVHIGDYQTRKFRTECIQPDERTREVAILFSVLESAQQAMLACIPVKKIKEKA